ncbi:MAG: alpha/beta hydrolase, partial [Actinomycetota bacterium]
MPAQPVPEDVSFDSAYGITLEGVLQLPEEPPSGVVVLCHPNPGLGGTMRTPLVVRLALGLVASGRAVLRFNFRGVGRSQGATTGGELEPLDVAAAVGYARDRLGVPRPALAGWSFGALMAMAHAGTDAKLSA